VRLAQETNALEPCENVGRAVAGAVVHDDQFERSVGLRLQRPNTATDVADLVVGRDDDAHRGAGRHDGVGSRFSLRGFHFLAPC
jgi:hypothetical protein